jgi:hypothetical protein
MRAGLVVLALALLLLPPCEALAASGGPVWINVGDCLATAPVAPNTSSYTTIPPTPQVLQGSFKVNVQTGTTYTVLTGDRCKLLKFTNAAAVAVSLPAAGTSFPNGWMAYFESRGVAGLTITPTSGTIEGVASWPVRQNTGVAVFSDGSNYHVFSTTLPIGTQYQMLRMGTVNPQWEDTPYDVYTDMPGVPANSALIRFAVGRPFLIPSGIPDGQCSAKTAATASTTVTFKKNGSSIGTFVWGAAATTCTITFSSTVTWAVGDIYELEYPATADATLANVAITTPGLRQ